MDRWTLDDAISYAKEVAEKNYRGAKFESIDPVDNDIKTNCIKCAEEHMQLAEWLEELKSYKELEKQDLLAKLPTALRSDVYFIISNNEIRHGICIEITLSNKQFYIKSYHCGKWFDFSDIGRRVFRTRKEAKKKLEKIKNDK